MKLSMSRRKGSGKGRTAITISISMPQSDCDYVTRRVNELGRACANTSHYFRMLLDLERGGNVSPAPKQPQQSIPLTPDDHDLMRRLDGQLAHHKKKKNPHAPPSALAHT